MNKMLAASKFKSNPGYGKSPNGLIMFQHHGQKVRLRENKNQGAARLNLIR